MPKLKGPGEVSTWGAGAVYTSDALTNAGTGKGSKAAEGQGAKSKKPPSKRVREEMELFTAKVNSVKQKDLGRLSASELMFYMCNMLEVFLLAPSANAEKCMVSEGKELGIDPDLTDWPTDPLQSGNTYMWSKIDIEKQWEKITHLLSGMALSGGDVLDLPT